MKSKLLAALVVLSLMSLWGGMALGSTTITAWWTVRKPIMDYSREEVKKFELEHPDIKVELVGIPEDAVQQKLLAGAVAGAEGPDIVYIDENVFKVMVNAGALQPIPEEVYTEEQIFEMYGPKVSMYKLDGKYYGFPNGDMAAVLFYNPEMLKDYGYSPLDIPDTWDEFIVVAQKMTDLSKDIQGFPIRGREGSMWNALLFQNGGFLFRNGKEAMFADKPAIDAFQFLQDIYGKYKVSSRTSLSANEAFGQGKAPFVYNWTWWIGSMLTSYPDTPFGTRVLPTPTGNPPYGSYGPSMGLFVSSVDPAKKEDVWEFYKFITSPDFQLGWAMLRGLIPARIEARKPEIFGKDPYRALAEAVEYGVPYSFYPDEIGKLILGTMVDKIMEGAPIAETVQETEEEVNKILQRRSEDCFIFGQEWYKAQKG